jgi:uncharacterized membrane protein
MKPVWRWLRPAVLAIAGIVYIALGYLASASNHPPILAVAVGAIPFVAGVIAACWNAPFRLPAMGLCIASLVAIGLNIDMLIRHASWLYFIQHAGAMGSLFIMFGSTLRTHEGALCSRIARIAIAEPLDAHYLHYTWRVTLAWTIYFLASALISVGLFFLAPLAIWALFAAVLTPVFLGLMFAGEFVIRLRALPGRPHFSIAQTIQSYRQYTMQRGEATAPRSPRNPSTDS